MIIALCFAASVYAQQYGIPRTGQTPTLPEAPPPTGADGLSQHGIVWPIPRFVINRDGTVTDTLTGLMWLQDAASLGSNWNQCRDYCETLDFAGHDDWRMPSMTEMRSIVHWGMPKNRRFSDTTGTAPWSEGDPFIGLSDVSKLWTTTPYWGDRYQVMRKDAWAEGQTPDTPFLDVWPVRTASRQAPAPVPNTEDWPRPRFTDMNDGTVRDNLTDLTWTKDAFVGGAQVTWWAARNACENLELAGHEDWRLPNVNEMLSLLDWRWPDGAIQISNAEGTGPWTEGDPFTRIQTQTFEGNIPPYYWTSSSHDTDYAIVVIPREGNLSGGGRNNASLRLPFWPVRGESVGNGGRFGGRGLSIIVR